MNKTQESLKKYLPVLREIESCFDKLLDEAETEEEQALAHEAWKRASSFVALVEVSES